MSRFLEEAAAGGGVEARRVRRSHSGKVVRVKKDGFDSRRGKEIHAQLVLSGLSANLYAMTSLMNLYAKCGAVQDAYKLFDRMPLRDLVCWNTVIACFAQNGMPRRALDLVAGMKEKSWWLFFSKNSSIGAIKLPPGPPKWPIFGNLLQLGHLPHRDLAALCDKYGPLVYLRLGHVDAITTNDPNIIREILRQQDDVFASRPRTLAAEHLAYNCGDVALAPLGPKWKRLRRICMENLLTTKRLESFSGHRSDEAQHLVRNVWASAQCGKEVNLRELLGAFSMNNVTRMLLGKQYFGVGSDAPQEATEFMHITHELFWLLGLIYLGDYLPIWRWVDPFGCEKKMRQVEKKVDEFHTKIIEQHRASMENQDDGQMDFVDVLLSLPGEDGKEHMDDIEIKALIQPT
ncbi:hypothetical protein SASPL_105878 [Salvia splendens]|uniref:Uncharacterized protein n=1 Tax=Salvia splendens TaxID=180675 RepID=A0A8X8YLV2_SALSN|nr:hypothetical protein SASPL_105878 [Salvia splendens]